MTEVSIKAILFDFGGVLAEEGFYNGLADLAIKQGLEVESVAELAMQSVYDSGFVLGRGTASDFWALLRKRSGLIGDDAVLTQRILDGFTPREWMLTLVRQLRELGLITCILSDQTYWLDELDAQYHFKSLFDHVFNSYYLGKGKRDPGLFKDVATALALPPPALLFIDDNAANIRRAQAAGWHAIHYVDRSDFMTALRGYVDNV